MATAFALFDTAIGPCGIAWTDRGISALQLPEREEARTRARLIRRTGGGRETAPPPDVQSVIGSIVALLDGERRDLSDVELDVSGVPEFDRQVYDVARTIPPGETSSYGAIATRLGVPRAAREVGQALGRNPFAIVVPCHRVVSADGRLGGFSANGGTTTKRRLLSIEGAAAAPPTLFG